MAHTSQFREEFSDWCIGEELPETHALMLVLSDDVKVIEIEETLHTIECLGRLRVRGKTFKSNLQRFFVLCECKESIDAKLVPPQIWPHPDAVPWLVVTACDDAPDADEFSTKLKLLLQSEGKTMSDVQAMFSTDTESPAPTSLLRAVGDLLDRIGKTSSDGGSFRRLRIFSGTFPTPVGEESFDLWNEQAYLMISECDCSDKEKKRRIMESIRGPALEVIKVARDDAPDLSSRDYVNALERAFGSAESGEDLYFTFRLMQQLPREKLSDFVRRLEKPLSKVLQKGGISLADKDRVRVEQLLRGADPRADLKLLQLRLRERLSNPPNFLQLLSEIRTEEEYEDSRANTVGVTDLKAHSPPDTVDHQQSDGYFCYRCGGAGHIANKCHNEENQRLVIQKVKQPFYVSATTHPSSDSGLQRVVWGTRVISTIDFLSY
uniref:CCHC-type domain-containing protein n=1 Tax=Denticeps clupeoides TaxID=299321 RepID=A0AAY4BXB6_9TELE